MDERIPSSFPTVEINEVGALQTPDIKGNQGGPT
jgi:hypothetical protein